MKLLSSAIIAFSMYSKIPMPQVEWNKENMKYIMCFFPLVGIANSVLLIVWLWLSSKIGIESILISIIATLIPLFVTGGIHLDGFCDTIDGLSSHQTIEKKLQILSDPNSGAFAVMGCVTYLLLYFALWTEIPLNSDSVLIISLSYILIRAYSGYSVVTFQCAKASGLAAAFSDAAQKKNVKIVMICYMFMISIIMFFINTIYFVAIMVAINMIFVYYKYMSKKQFGGITGDLAGFFLQVAELSVLIAFVIVDKIC